MCRVNFPALGLMLGLLAAGWSAPTAAGSLADLIARAEALASRDWQAPSAVAADLSALDYDQYRAIRFDPDRALWADREDFRIQFFHPGFLFTAPVQIHEVVAGTARPVPFEPERFRFDPPLDGPPLSAAQATGYAGFRVHFPINRDEVHDEFLVFLGASYFRLIGRSQVYGLSARGLALDSGGSGDEEFPVFREFWLERPPAGESALVILALLDSPSVTGAYRFEVRPGEPSSIDIDAHLFARRDLQRPGIAPLTSMYTHGDSGPFLVDDFRPRVHDSDGLAVISSRGEAQWRPLSNRAQLRLSGFGDDAPPRGFGLLQRHREFRDYQDIEARYDLRPGKWVEPLDGDWGRGRVELVEIPTADETHDNIVAFWVPEEPIPAGQSRHYRYRLSTVGVAEPFHARARVVATSTGRGGVPGQDSWQQREYRRFVIDFRGAALVDGSGPNLASEASAGRLVEARLEALPADDGVRAVVVLAPDPEGAPSDLRVFLHRDGTPVSEVWTYVWYPDELDHRL